MYKLKPVVPVPMLNENTCRMYKLKDLQQMSFSGVPMSDKSDEVSVVSVFHLSARFWLSVNRLLVACLPTLEWKPSTPLVACLRSRRPVHR